MCKSPREQGAEAKEMLARDMCRPLTAVAQSVPRAGAARAVRVAWPARRV